MNVRYQADADLNQVIVTGVLRREPAIDFQTAFAAGLGGVKDPEVLAIAAQQERILVILVIFFLLSLQFLSWQAF